MLGFPFPLCIISGEVSEAPCYLTIVLDERPVIPTEAKKGPDLLGVGGGLPRPDLLNICRVGGDSFP